MSLSSTEQRILEFYEAGWSQAAIAEELGITLKTVGNTASRLRQQGYSLPSIRKTDPETITQILHLRDDEGLSFGDIANRLGMHKGTVGNIYQREAGQEASTKQASKQASRLAPKQASQQASGKHQVIPQEYVGLLLEIAEWWKANNKEGKPRQAFEQVLEQASKQALGQTKKQTYPIEEDLIERLKEESDRTGIPRWVIVNQALRRLFGNL